MIRQASKFSGHYSKRLKPGPNSPGNGCADPTAPEGQLDSALPTLMDIAMSVREVPNWSRLKAQHLAKMQQIKIEGAVAVHQIRMGAIAGKLKARKQRQAGSSLTRRVSNYAPPTLAHVCHLTLIPF